MRNSPEKWYIVRPENPQAPCLITTETPNAQQQFWGPFPTQGDAIAARIGLIRAGKCTPQ